MIAITLNKTFLATKAGTEWTKTKGLDIYTVTSFDNLGFRLESFTKPWLLSWLSRSQLELYFEEIPEDNIETVKLLYQR